jgi:ferredoxin-NADP reductase
VVDRVQPGDVLDIEGPFGSLRFIESGRPVVMVALGHGIAPFLSMLRDTAERRVSVPITLYYGGSPEERVFSSELAGLRRVLAGFEVVQPPAGINGDSSSGLSVLTQLVASALRDASCYDAYLSGSPAMCDALSMLLAAKGLPEDRIRSEKFYPALR